MWSVVYENSQFLHEGVLIGDEPISVVNDTFSDYLAFPVLSYILVGLLPSQNLFL